MAKKTKAAPAPEPVDEDEDLELEELDEDVEETEPEKAKPSKATDTVTFGASHLAALASEQTGKKYDAKTVRTLLRKMARSGELDREVSAQNRTRYDWTGPDDPEVKKILKKIKGGAIEEARNDALGKLKAKKEAERAAKAAAAEKATAKSGKKAKVTAPPIDDDDDVEDLEDDD
jgi:hypothetical protein